MSNNNRTISYLFLLGALSVFYSLAMPLLGFPQSLWFAITGIVGVVSLFICVMKLVRPYHWRKVMIVLSSGIWAIMFLMLVNILANRFDHQWDVTAAKQNTLTMQTKEYLSKIKAPVRITAFHVGLPPKYLEDMFRAYERAAKGTIKTEIIDPMVQLGYAAQFGTVINGKEKKVFIQIGDQATRKEIDFSDVPLTEEQLTNAIVQSLRSAKTVYFLTGHNEYRIDIEEATGLSNYVKLLTDNNIKAKQLLIGVNGDIPKDCDALVVAGPKQFLTPHEDEVINEYLLNGGDALFLVENVLITTPGQPLTEEQLKLYPSLNEILEQWGVSIASDIAVDLASHASGDVGSPATRNYMTHKAIVNGLDYTFYVRPRSISMKQDRRPTVKIAPLVVTASTKESWGETDRHLNVKYDEGIDRSGPVPIAFVMFERKGEGDGSDTRLAVFTDADFITNLYIDYYSNAQMGLNVLNWLLESDYDAFMGEHKVEVPRLDLTSMQKKTIVLLLLLMPVGVAIIGIFIWIRQT